MWELKLLSLSNLIKPQHAQEREENRIININLVFQIQESSPAVSDGSVWNSQWGHRPESENLADQRAENRKSVSVTVLWVSALQYSTQLLVYFGLYLKVRIKLSSLTIYM